MKTLYLVRHAKSSWEYDLDDHQRPLNERGLRDGPRVAAHVASVLPKPDVFMSSDAVRAQTTAGFFASAYGIPKNQIVLEPRMYDFAGDKLLQIIRTCPETVTCLMLFGHNNAMTTLVNVFGDKIIDNLPTAGCAAIRFEVDSWKEIAEGKTFFYCTPKELRQ